MNTAVWICQAVMAALFLASRGREDQYAPEEIAGDRPDGDRAVSHACGTCNGCC
jgi:hypothetical protein